MSYYRQQFTAANALKLGSYAYANRKEIAAKASLLFGAAKGKSTAVTPAVSLKNTSFKSYLDKTYEKKCGVEVKQFAFNSLSGVPTVPLAAWLNPFDGVAQGLTDSTRQGNSIEIKSFRIRCIFSAPATQVISSLVRIIVMKQGNMQGTQPAAAAILQSTSDPVAFYSFNKNESFTILKDDTVKIAPYGSGKDTTYVYNYTYRPKGCHVLKWAIANINGALIDMIHGNLALKWMCASSAANVPVATYSYICEYVDV